MFREIRNLLFIVAIVVHSQSFATGSCDESDKSHLYPGNHAFAEAIYACSGISGLDADCFKSNYEGMTDSCVECYTDMASCTTKRCLGSCMFSPRGIGCRDCARRECGDELEDCTGIPREQSPDFLRAKPYRLMRLRTSAQIF